MDNKQKNNLPPPLAWKPARITTEAHANLTELRELLAKEKGFDEVTYIQAASFAINDLTIRIKRKQARRARLFAERSVA